jgi:hypothetical protein
MCGKQVINKVFRQFDVLRLGEEADFEAPNFQPSKNFDTSTILLDFGIDLKSQTFNKHKFDNEINYQNSVRLSLRKCLFLYKFVDLYPLFV